MARIDYCDTSKSSERTKEILGKNRNANIFRMMAHSPSYFEQYCRLGGAIRHKGELDPVVRELAITRTGILCEAPYEIVAHKRIGKNVGVTDEQNAALDDWKSASCFNELQRAAPAFAGSPMLSAKALKLPQRHFEGGCPYIRQDIRRAMRFQQRHFSERHSRGQCRKPDAIGQRDVDDPASEEEQRRCGLAGSDDLLPRPVASDRAQRGETGKFLGRQLGEQRLFG